MRNLNPKFTIFTPVYNGAKHLARLFESINNLTFIDFEWIVIDDGSTDNSADLIEGFIKEHPSINSIFIKQPNMGKHLSWNKAVEIASGELFVPADADDAFVPDTLLFFNEKWHSFSTEQRKQLSGINVLCFDNDKVDIVGNEFPQNGMLSNNLELYYKLGLEGEKWGCIRTDLLKKRPFPIVDGSFYPESYLWFYLAKKYQVACFNTPLRRYYTTETGLSNSNRISKRTVKQAKVHLHYLSWFLQNFALFTLRYAPKELIRMLILGVFDSVIVVKSRLSLK